MAEDLAWMTQQRDNLKAELDALNPKCDEAMLALKDCRAANLAMTTERDRLATEHATKDEAIGRQRQAIADQAAQATTLQESLAAANQLNSELQGVITRQRAIITKWYGLAAEVFAESVNEAIAKG